MFERASWRKLGRTVAIIVLASTLTLAARSGEAAPLDLTLQRSPIMMSDFIDVRYEAATGSLTAYGYAEQFVNGSGDPVIIKNGIFAIAAKVGNDGTITSGTLTITGEVPSLGLGQGTLLAGTISKMGSSDVGAPLEFQVATGDGSLAFNFGPQVNVILSQSSFPGSFRNDFNNQATAVAGIGW